MPLVTIPSTSLVNGFDRADGLSGRAGTTFSASQILVSGPPGMVSISTIATEEIAGYPKIQRGEQCTIVHKFRMSQTNCLTKLSYVGRGVYLEDSYGNVSRVQTADAEPEANGVAWNLTVTAESISFDTPPDKFTCTPVEMGINILKFPRYYYAFLADGEGGTANLLNQQVIRLLQDYFENVTQPYRDNVYNILKNSLSTPGSTSTLFPEGYAKKNARTDTALKVTGTELAKRAAMEIIMKYWRGEDSPYMVGAKMVWSRFYWKSQFLHPGGVVEDPFFGASVNPHVPSYFYSPAWPDDDSVTLFDRYAAYNRQCYSDSGTRDDDVVWSALRQADNMDEDRTWFRVDRSWNVAFVGNWDAQFYRNGNRPVVPGDYLLLNLPFAPP